MDAETTVNLFSVALQKHVIGMQVSVPINLIRRAEVVTGISHVADRLVASLKTYLVAGAHECGDAEVSRPASWWDHFKQDEFPAWAKKIWPPIYTTETVFQPKNVYVCPHDNLAWPDKNHIEWLMRTEK